MHECSICLQLLVVTFHHQPQCGKWAMGNEMGNKEDYHNMSELHCMLKSKSKSKYYNLW